MKKKKEKRFANVEMVLDIIQKNKKILDDLPNSYIQLEKREISLGDEWDSEEGYEYLILFSDKTAYLVGMVKVIEDRENYAQADSWTQTHCVDYYQERNVTSLEVLEKIELIIKQKQKILI